jgi:hypothetical protein
MEAAPSVGHDRVLQRERRSGGRQGGGGTSQLGGLLVFYGYTWAGGTMYAANWNTAMTGPTLPSVMALG